MVNLQEILNDPELYAELEKAYAIAMPYRPKVLYRLHTFLQFWPDLELAISELCVPSI